MSPYEITEKTSKIAVGLFKKGRKAKEIFGIKSEISTCESVISRAYTAIGRKYYAMFTEGGYDPEFEKQMKDIKNAMKAIKDLEEKIDDIKADI